MKSEIRITSDGSPTLFVPEINEHYHSVHGAMAESRHVFIEAGLKKALENTDRPLQVLEIGVGTGLNLFLSSMGSEKIHYTGIEPFPPDAELLKQYHAFFPEIPADFGAKMYASPEMEVAISECLTFLWMRKTWDDFPAEKTYDLIYMDAFSPEKQPELWTEAALKKIALVLRPGGICVSYCARGAFRRELQAAGLQVEKLPGPPGKREMVRAWKGKE